MLGCRLFLVRFKFKDNEVEEIQFQLSYPMSLVNDEFCKEVRIKSLTLKRDAQDTVEIIADLNVPGEVKSLIILPLGLSGSLITHEVEKLVFYDLNFKKAKRLYCETVKILKKLGY